MSNMDKVRELLEGGWEHDTLKRTGHVLYLLGIGVNQSGMQFGVVWDPVKKTVRHIDRWEQAT